MAYLTMLDVISISVYILGTFIIRVKYLQTVSIYIFIIAVQRLFCNY
jgi:hypothetical protein